MSLADWDDFLGSGSPPRAPAQPQLAATMPEMIAEQLAGWGSQVDVISPDVVREHLSDWRRGVPGAATSAVVKTCVIRQTIRLPLDTVLRRPAWSSAGTAALSGWR